MRIVWSLPTFRRAWNITSLLSADTHHYFCAVCSEHTLFKRLLYHLLQQHTPLHMHPLYSSLPSTLRVLTLEFENHCQGNPGSIRNFLRYHLVCCSKTDLEVSLRPSSGQPVNIKSIRASLSRVPNRLQDISLEWNIALGTGFCNFSFARFVSFGVSVCYHTLYSWLFPILHLFHYLVSFHFGLVVLHFSDRVLNQPMPITSRSAHIEYSYYNITKDGICLREKCDLSLYLEQE
jgi:hypothetical protein